MGKKLLMKTGTTMFFDNRCIKSRGAVDLKCSIFRISRMINKTVRYQLLRFKCDLVTIYFCGHLAWTTALFKIDPAVRLPPGRGEINEVAIDEIEELLKVLKDHQ